MTKWARLLGTARRKTHVCAKSIPSATFSVTVKEINCPQQNARRESSILPCFSPSYFTALLVRITIAFLGIVLHRAKILVVQCIIVPFCMRYLKVLTHAEAWMCSIDLEELPHVELLPLFLKFMLSREIPMERERLSEC